jgi:la-related protein 4
LAIFRSSDENISIKDIKQEVGNMWYITFDNEEDTINMLFQLRGKRFKGKPIAGRIKSEAILRNL